MSEQRYWEEYDVIHNNKGKSPLSMKRLLEKLDRYTDKKILKESKNNKKK